MTSATLTRATTTTAKPKYSNEIRKQNTTTAENAHHGALRDADGLDVIARDATGGQYAPSHGTDAADAAGIPSDGADAVVSASEGREQPGLFGYRMFVAAA